MITEDQSEVVTFLASPATHAGATVERIETHTSLVFLAGTRAWKPKRAVRYDYLDFSTIDRRRAMCEAEVLINRRSAPDDDFLRSEDSAGILRTSCRLFPGRRWARRWSTSGKTCASAGMVIAPGGECPFAAKPEAKVRKVEVQEAPKAKTVAERRER
jgi:hypothetical protein